MGDIIEVQHLVKRHDGFTAVDDLPFAVAQGPILRPAGLQRGR